MLKYSSNDKNNVKYVNGLLELMDKMAESHKNIYWKTTIKYINKESWMQNSNI